MNKKINPCYFMALCRGEWQHIQEFGSVLWSLVQIVLLQGRNFLMLMLVEIILLNSCTVCPDPETPKHSLILEDSVPFILSLQLSLVRSSREQDNPQLTTVLLLIYAQILPYISEVTGKIFFLFIFFLPPWTSMRSE